MRQHLVLMAMLAKTTSAEYVSKLPELVHQYRRVVRNDIGASRRLALAMAAPNFTSSTVEFTDTIGKLIERLEVRYGMELPLADLFLWGTPAARPVDKIESAKNAGQDFVGADRCDHYAFRQAKADWQIWITAGSRPLPR